MSEFRGSAKKPGQAHQRCALGVRMATQADMEYHRALSPVLGASHVFGLEPAFPGPLTFSQADFMLDTLPERVLSEW